MTKRLIPLVAAAALLACGCTTVLKSKEFGDVKDLHIFNNAEVLMSIGVGGVSLPLPYVISYRELQYSCSLTRRPRPPIGAGRDGEGDKSSLNEEMRRLLEKIPDGGSK